MLDKGIVVVYASSDTLKYVVYIFYTNPYIARGHHAVMKGSTSKVFRVTSDAEMTLIKTSFLSYYISMYNAVNENLGYKNEPVSIDEIYDFLQDLRHEAGEHVPDIEKEDIAFSFHVLRMLGICKSP